MTTRRTILVTGAAGHLGSEVLARLVKREHHVIALVHNTSGIIDNAGRPIRGVRTVVGDVRHPDFGLDASTVGAIGTEVGTIVHCAALTDFGLPEQRYGEVNVDGTANAVALAGRWDADYLHVSTTYVCGEFNGTFYEDQLDVGQSFGNGYELSKSRAERIVQDSGLRWAVVRPGIVSGDHITGHSREHKHIYQVLKLMTEGRLRTLPGHYSATLALSPIGHVADTVVAATERLAANVGRTFHAVGAEPVSLQQISDVLAEYPCLQVADFVPPSTFNVDDLEVIERGYFQKVGALYTSYLLRRLAFDTANTRDRLGLQAPRTGAGYVRKVLDSCLRTGYLGRPPRSIADVLATLHRQEVHV